MSNRRHDDNVDVLHRMKVELIFLQNIISFFLYEFPKYGMGTPAPRSNVYMLHQSPDAAIFILAIYLDKNVSNGPQKWRALPTQCTRQRFKLSSLSSISKNDFTVRQDLSRSNSHSSSAPIFRNNGNQLVKRTARHICSIHCFGNSNYTSNTIPEI